MRSDASVSRMEVAVQHWIGCDTWARCFYLPVWSIQHDPGTYRDPCQSSSVNTRVFVAAAAPVQSCVACDQGFHAEVGREAEEEVSKFPVLEVYVICALAWARTTAAEAGTSHDEFH